LILKGSQQLVAAILSGSKGGDLQFSGGFRFAQPPANGLNSFGMKNSATSKLARRACICATPKLARLASTFFIVLPGKASVESFNY
jgi:hypothetical protein